MKKLLVLTLSFLTLSLSAQDEKKAATPADRLVEVMEFQKSIMDGGEAGFVMVEESLANQNLTKAELAEVKDAFMAYMMKLANDAELKAKTTELYTKNFTADEIEELIAFYQTPVGKKTIVALPEITGEIMKLSTTLAQKHVGSFQEALTGVLERKAAKEQKEEK